MDPSSSLSSVPYKRKRNEDYSCYDEPFRICKWPKLPVELFDADHPVGIEPQTKDLISKLRSSDPDSSITTALGIRGPGKTTIGMDLSLSLSLVPYKKQRDEDYFRYDDADDDEPFRGSKRPKHDVFLSYSNEDIGKSFVSHLKGALLRHDFDVFDHTALSAGQHETSELLKAIEESWIFVVAFSMEYLFSEKCLDELVLIMDFISKLMNRRRVVPIFYKINPSQVQSQQHGSFVQAFQAHHHNNVDDERVEKWKHALEYVGNLAGYCFETWENEEEFVSKIANRLGKLRLPVELSDADHPVGIERRANDLVLELRLGNPDPSITAVLGMSGSGKTTLVKAVFDKVVPDFDANCFIEDIRYYKHKGPNWKVDLQKDVISRFTKDDHQIHNVSASSKIRKFVSNRKVLLVLDDVDKYEQLQALGIHDPASFGWGSRILVTTTNKQSLCGLKKYTSYNMELLNLWESYELFTGLAYEEGQSADEEFVDELLYLSGGVPLVLEVWGRYFKSHESKKWPRLLEKLRRIPHEDVQKKLQVGYDSLSPKAKKLFLDIACFFDGMNRDLVIKVLQDEDNECFPDIEIQDLIDRYLVKEDKIRLTMHVIIRDMGREVVRQENEDDPGQRSRLMGKDVVRVLRDCSGTDSIRSIYLDCSDSNEDVTLQVDVFKKMSNLRFIKLLMKCSFSNDEIISPLCFKHLKYLEWQGFPFKSLDKFDMGNVLVIKLFLSKLEVIWEGEPKCLNKLRILVLDLNGLTKTGSFIGLENLEVLQLRGCRNLEELDGSIGCLQKLVTLNLEGCHNLKELDGSIGCLHNLKELDLNRCFRLKSLPWNMICKLASLEKLYMQFCPNILNISYELLNLPNIFNISYQLESMGRLWNLARYSHSKLMASSYKLDTAMGGTSERQGGTLDLPKFRYINVSFKSHQQKSVLVYWSK